MIKNPSHPGLVLKRLYVEPLGLNANKLAILLEVPRSRTTRILKGQTDITLDTAIRLAKLFDTTEELWLNMQTNYDLANKRTDADAAKIKVYQPEKNENKIRLYA